MHEFIIDQYFHGSYSNFAFFGLFAYKRNASEHRICCIWMEEWGHLNVHKNLTLSNSSETNFWLVSESIILRMHRILQQSSLQTSPIKTFQCIVQ